MSFAENNVTGGSGEILLVPQANYIPNFFLAKAVVCMLLPLVLWRAWKFTILPILRPDQPKEFPYWIPCKNYALLHVAPMYTLTTF